jgi:arginine N-succinyltransferase
MSANHYVIRAMGTRDFESLRRLRDLAGPGFTSLSVNDQMLRERLALSESSFASRTVIPGKERYTLALEHRATGEVVGLAAVKSTVGDVPPFFNFRVLQIAQSSFAAQRRFDMEVLILVNEFTNCTEVGSLFVHPDHRAGGVGRMMAQSRYLLMKSAPQRFNPIVVSELRGVVDEDGVSPFWEYLGRHFFRMEFKEADQLSATSDNQFILDLMPKYPIYVDLLPEAARAVIGKTHPHGVGARKLLEWEGFRYDRVVDIFEGGPLVSAARDSIRTFREAQVLTADIATPVAVGHALVATGDLGDFRCTSAPVAIAGDFAHMTAQTADALQIRTGDQVIVWRGADAH